MSKRNPYDKTSTGVRFDYSQPAPASKEELEDKISRLKTLDQEKLDQARIMPASAADPPVERESVDHKLRVLIAEDNPLNQKKISQMLEQENYQVDLASNGKEALARLQERFYHALLLDCEMPVMDGYELIKALRAIENRVGPDQLSRKVRVIALAVHLTPEDSTYLKNIGADASITKPVIKDKLLNLLNELIEK